MSKSLSREGEAFRQKIAEAGIELTCDELAEGIREAQECIRPRPDGCCIKYGQRTME